MKHQLDFEKPIIELQNKLDELKKHPHNGWSLVGLREALAAQKKPAAEVEKDFQQSWARSDTWIRASRF